MKDVLLLDGHCHLASTRYIPESFLSGAAANMAARAKAYGNKTANQGMLTDVLVRQHQDHTGDVLVREMDAAGIARTVLLYPDFGLALDGCPEPEVAIEEHLAVCERHAGRFELFAGVDPRRERAFERFERFVGAPHLKGLKLYPACGYSASDAALDPFYELCGARGMPVLFHSGPTTPALFYEFTAPFDVDRAAKRFPRVNFIIGHGGVHDTEQASLLCAHRPNVFLDISGFVHTLDSRGWKAQLAALFRQRLNHKIIFGTDWPVARKTGGLKELVHEFLAEEGPLTGLSQTDIELILSGNMLRLLAPQS